MVALVVDEYRASMMTVKPTLSHSVHACATWVGSHGIWTKEDVMLLGRYLQWCLLANFGRAFVCCWSLLAMREVSCNVGSLHEGIVLLWIWGFLLQRGSFSCNNGAFMKWGSYHALEVALCNDGLLMQSGFQMTLMLWRGWSYFVWIAGLLEGTHAFKGQTCLCVVQLTPKANCT